MSEKVSIKLPPGLAQMVRPDAPVSLKHQVISGDVDARAWERVTQLFFLCYDRDAAVKSAAIDAFRQLPFSVVQESLSAPELNPRVAALLARFFPEIIARTAPETADAAEAATPVTVGTPVVQPSADAQQSDSAAAAVQIAEIATKPVETEPEEEVAKEEEFRSKYQLAQEMGVGEKIKMALTGDKEWRSILVKDSNKLVNGAVVKNPRITEPEILAICKSVIQNDEIIRTICMNKEWVKNYEIRKAIVLNTKTALPVALRFMGFLSEKDLGTMAKSKNISSVLSNQARRLLANKKKD